MRHLIASPPPAPWSHRQNLAQIPSHFQESTQLPGRSVRDSTEIPRNTPTAATEQTFPTHQTGGSSLFKLDRAFHPGCFGFLVFCSVPLFHLFSDSWLVWTEGRREHRIHLPASFAVNIRLSQQLGLLTSLRLERFFFFWTHWRAYENMGVANFNGKSIRFLKLLLPVKSDCHNPANTVPEVAARKIVQLKHHHVSSSHEALPLTRGSCMLCTHGCGRGISKRL